MLFKTESGGLAYVVYPDTPRLSVRELSELLYKKYDCRCFVCGAKLSVMEVLDAHCRDCLDEKAREWQQVSAEERDYYERLFSGRPDRTPPPAEQPPAE